mgnify:CR=1 FL=1
MLYKPQQSKPILFALCYLHSPPFGGVGGGSSYCKLNPTAYALIFVTIDSKPLLRVGERC